MSGDPWNTQSGAGAGTGSGAAPTVDPPASGGAGSAGARVLRRSTDDRMVAGVCGGVGRYTGIDPVVYRIVIAVLTVFGGIGLLLYGAGWLLIPDDGAPESEGQRLLRGRATGTVIAALLVTVIGIIVLANLARHGTRASLVIIAVLGVLVAIVASQRHGPSAPSRPATSAAYQQPYVSYQHVPYQPPASRRPAKQPSYLVPIVLSAAVVVAGVLVAVGAGHRVDVKTQTVLAGALLTVGLGLVAGAWFGRARWLIAIGALLTAGLVVAATFDVPLRGGIGERFDAPTNVSDVHRAYHVGIGQENLDLSQLQLAGRTEKVSATVGLGRLRLQVPADATVVVRGYAGAGDLVLFGVERSGTHITSHATQRPSNSTGTIELDLRVGAGRVDVSRGGQ